MKSLGRGLCVLVAFGLKSANDGRERMAEFLGKERAL